MKSLKVNPIVLILYMASGMATMGVLSTVIVFTLSVVGVIVGYAILNKHFEKKQIQA